MKIVGWIACAYLLIGLIIAVCLYFEDGFDGEPKIPIFIFIVFNWPWFGGGQ